MHALFNNCGQGLQTDCCLSKLCAWEKYPDENYHYHALAKSYGCGGAEDICDYAAI